MKTTSECILFALAILVVTISAQTTDTIGYPQPKWKIGDTWNAVLHRYSRPWLLDKADGVDAISTPVILSECGLKIAVVRVDSSTVPVCWVLKFEFAADCTTEHMDDFSIWVSMCDGCTMRIVSEVSGLSKHVRSESVGSCAMALRTDITYAPLLLFPWNLYGGVLDEQWMIFFPQSMPRAKAESRCLGDYFRYKRQNGYWLLTWMSGKTGFQEGRRKEQLWDRGVNWWRSYSVYDNGHLWLKANVLTYNGRAVE